MKRAFTEAQDKLILTGRLDDKADSAQKKKLYNLKLRILGKSKTRG